MKKGQFIVGFLVAALLAGGQSFAAEAQVTTEWHEGTWVEGGYEDRDTIVLSPAARGGVGGGKKRSVPAPVFVRQEEPRPTPAILIRGNERVTVSQLGVIPIPDYGYTPEPREKKESSLTGPSMGFSGGRKIRTFYPGSHISSWTWSAKQRVRE